MKRRNLMVTLVSLLVVAPIGLAIAAGTGPAVMRIDSNKGGKFVKSFQHKAHQGRSKCADCHHKAKKGAKPKKCATCHTLANEPDPKTGAPGFKKAFHKQCQGCHKKKADKPELRKCDTCHG